MNQYKEENVPSGVGQQDVSNEGVQSVSEDTERKSNFGVDDTCYFGCLWRIFSMAVSRYLEHQRRISKIDRRSERGRIGGGFGSCRERGGSEEAERRDREKKMEKEKRERIRRESAELIREAKEEEIGDGLEVVESEEELKNQKEEIEKRREVKEEEKERKRIEN